ncbi:MAG: FG-GAP repeat protein [Saccharospirillum sp.]|nr:FG-GAP repeat protein [Saccharospirillum sp.]
MSGYTEVAELDAGHNRHDLQVFLPERINASYLLTACNNNGCTESAPVFVAGTLAESVGYIKASNPGPDNHFGMSVALSNDGSILAVGTPAESSNAVGIDGDQSDNTAYGGGAVYVFARNGAEWVQQAYLKASNSDEGDGFGESLAIATSGSTLAVGAPNEASNARGVDGDQTDNSSPGSGAVYLFTRIDGNWSQQSYIKATNTESDDRFGHSVKLSEDGNTLAVGAIGDSSNAMGVDGDQTNNSASNSGSVFIFTRDIDSWSQQAYLKASNTRAGNAFGWAVSLASDGDTLAVGAVGESSSAVGVNGNQSDNSAPVSGAVYIFQRDNTIWSQQAYIKASNTGAFERFGGAVALAGSGDTVAVGAYFESNGLALSGAVYVFNRSGSDWFQQTYLKASNLGANDRFGASLAITDDGNTLAVGALFESSNATGIEGDQFDESTSRSGAVYLFKLNGTNWVQHAYIKASNTGVNDHFGNSVAIAGNGSTLAVGAYQEAGTSPRAIGDQFDNSLERSGAVYLY